MQPKLPGKGRKAVSEEDSIEEERTAARMVKVTSSRVKKVCKIKKGFKQYENFSTHIVLKELPHAGQASWSSSQSR